MARRPDPDTPALRAIAAARVAFDEAEALYKQRREELLSLMTAEASREGGKISQVARAARYEAAYVRRILRERGVAPKQPERIPPPGFKRAPAVPDEVDA